MNLNKEKCNLKIINENKGWSTNSSSYSSMENLKEILNVPKEFIDQYMDSIFYTKISRGEECEALFKDLRKSELISVNFKNDDLDSYLADIFYGGFELTEDEVNNFTNLSFETEVDQIVENIYDKYKWSNLWKYNIEMYLMDNYAIWTSLPITYVNKSDEFENISLKPSINLKNKLVKQELDSKYSSYKFDLKFEINHEIYEYYSWGQVEKALKGYIKFHQKVYNIDGELIETELVLPDTLHAYKEYYDGYDNSYMCYMLIYKERNNDKEEEKMLLFKTKVAAKRHKQKLTQDIIENKLKEYNNVKEYEIINKKSEDKLAEIDNS